MGKTNVDNFYIKRISDLEIRSFNLMLEKLMQNKNTKTSSILESMSGLRTKTHRNPKVKLPISKNLLRKWHKMGIITIFRDKIRVGNVLLYSDILNEKNQKILLEHFR